MGAAACGGSGDESGSAAGTGAFTGVVGGSGGDASGGSAPTGGVASTGGTGTGGTVGVGGGDGGTGGVGGGSGGDLGTGGTGGSDGSGGENGSGGAGDTGGSGGTDPGPDCTGKIAQKQTLVSGIYTADPSGHVFDGKLYVYPSHDIPTNIPESNDGAQFAMEDYHVLSLDTATCSWVDEGEVLHLDDVPWAKKQLWAPDAVKRGSTYYLVFPARDSNDIFRIGVATSTSPTGPFTARSQPIPGAYSIDPTVFVDDDDQMYLYVGGLWGGQLEKWRTGTFNSGGTEPTGSSPALGPRVAKLNADLTALEGSLQEISIRDQNGSAITASDENRRFFEGAWIHKYQGTYYLSYSTGTTHYIAYATGTSPLGPFTYRGRILQPPSGWTTHHSIVEYRGTWYLFYHDTQASGQTHLRNVKVQVLTHAADGSIATLTP